MSAHDEVGWEFTPVYPGMPTTPAPLVFPASEQSTTSSPSTKMSFLQYMNRPAWPGAPILFWHGIVGTFALAAIATGVTLFARKRSGPSSPSFGGVS